MLDLIFLVLMIIIFIKAFQGTYNETLCNVALVTGIIASVIGMVNCFVTDSSVVFLDMFSPSSMGLLNLAVFLIAIFQKPAAKLLVKNQKEKEAEQLRIIEEESTRVKENFFRNTVKPDNASQIDYMLDENGCIDIHAKRDSQPDAPSDERKP